jgi:type III pantothenate kinase
MSSPRHLIAINVGNTRTAVAHFEDGNITPPQRFSNADVHDIIDHVVATWRSITGRQRLDEGDVVVDRKPDVDVTVVLASVNDPVAATIARGVEDQLTEEVYRIGEDIEAPIGRQLDPETVVGVDRLLSAAGAFDILKQACVIVDAGTAITVDFVDGQGTFHGGAIAPGAAMQLKALHAQTAALPDLPFRAPEDEPFGRNTAQAMYQGVFHGIRGMVQRLVERYAEAYGAYPLVVATGGDAQALFGNEPLIDRIVPDLTLIGIEIAARLAVAQEPD